VGTTLLERCILAGQECAAACEAALESDASYTNPGTNPYTSAHLTLVSCAAVCSLVVRALREGDGDLELVRWCSEVCTQCATADCPEGVAADAWVQVVDACTRYATDCRTLEERISQYAHRVFRDHRDSDFQALVQA
jgi:hypothetical protein